MSYNNGPRIVTNGLVLLLDAGNTKSYPGSGNTWFDLSGNNNHFNIVSTAYNSSGKYMDFRGSHGCAKNSSNINLSDTNGVTYVVWTRVLNSTSSWRTLTRAYNPGDHHVIIQNGAWNIGMYDNNANVFIGTNFSQQNLPGNGTNQWICMHWRWQNISPYYEFSYNDTPNIIRGSLTDIRSRYERGFGAIGGFHNENTNPSSALQFWGDIAIFQCYNRRLTNAEILQNYNATKGRFNL